jgi:hypothetical protein
VVHIELNEGNFLAQDGSRIDADAYANWFVSELQQCGVPATVTIHRGVEGPTREPVSDLDNISAGLAEEDAARDLLMEDVPEDLWRQQA